MSLKVQPKTPNMSVKCICKCFNLGTCILSLETSTATPGSAVTMLYAECKAGKKPQCSAAKGEHHDMAYPAQESRLSFECGVSLGFGAKDFSRGIDGSNYGKAAALNHACRVHVNMMQYSQFKIHAERPQWPRDSSTTARMLSCRCLASSARDCL